MSMRKLKRRQVLLDNRFEVIRTYSMGTGRYTGTWRFWRESRRRPAWKVKD